MQPRVTSVDQGEDVETRDGERDEVGAIVEDLGWSEEDVGRKLVDAERAELSADLLEDRQDEMVRLGLEKGRVSAVWPVQSLFTKVKIDGPMDPCRPHGAAGAAPGGVARDVRAGCC